MIDTSKGVCVPQIRNRFETLKQKKYQAEEPDYVPDGEGPSCSSLPQQHTIMGWFSLCRASCRPSGRSCFFHVL